jgi:hypothetical protein
MFPSAPQRQSVATASPPLSVIILDQFQVPGSSSFVCGAGFVALRSCRAVSR